MTNIFKQIYIRTTGYSYTNMGRLFLRLFAGVMLMQFGLRQIYHYSQELSSFPSIMGLQPETGMTLMIIVEIACSLFIMAGFCTRIMCIPPMVAMTFAEYYLLETAREASYLTSWTQNTYLPVMFLGIYFFIMLVGPGKISVDYFLSLHFIHSDNQSEEELEEV
ncbi:MAG: DoxX family protein [Candidatus Amulumruptor caecigallinarius]|nr:DoxX family protein [Candidatus Amulumruptor caecigallinarius]